MNAHPAIRPCNSLLATIVSLLLGWTLPSFGAPDPRAEGPIQRASIPELRIRVDPSVELVSLLFRLAGNPEYSQCRVPSYAADVDRQFNRFRDHSAVQLARTLRQTRGVSYDACISLAVLLTDNSEPRLSVALDPWPDFLDQRWDAKSVNNFVAAAGQFVKDTGFTAFIKAHEGLYRTSESRMRLLMDREAHLDWFNRFFGERPKASFTLILGMLNGGSCYGARSRDKNGAEELFCVLGVWATDEQGVPVFGKDVLSTVVHEFCHSYANPIIDRHASELRESGEQLYVPVAGRMRSQAYGNAVTMLRESLVRASVVRYLSRYEGEKAAEREISEQQTRGFEWMKELSGLLGQYESERDHYPTLQSFSPRLVTFFRDYAGKFQRKHRELDASRPKVVSIVPANGAADVDPGTRAIQVVFDRPMRGGSWSMCGGGPKFPEPTDKPNYDKSRTTWTVKVNLKPDWEYEFWLNSGQYQSFQSEDGVPLESVHVTFKTGSPAPHR
ncbi:MAG: DUF4932 domain-containing protein [Verrucomicrobiia bacterium]